ncbi:MAG TPA: redoxin domain-containing protein [Gemmataceae bacterium]|nr:redoxin domain-containing protein [Gemmataceae bacterium]
MRTLLSRLGLKKPWQRCLLVAVLSFPLALGVRQALQAVVPVNLAADAVEYVRRYKERPLSEPLTHLLNDTAHPRVPTQPHALLGQEPIDFTLLDDQGAPVCLEELRRDGPVVLVFYYGYRCSHCVSQLFALNEDLALFRELGAQVVAVSADAPEFTAERFREYGRFDFPVLSDPGNQVARSYGVYRPASDDGPEELLHATFLIGTDGCVFWVNCGPTPFLDNKTLLQEIAQHEGVLPPG